MVSMVALWWIFPYSCITYQQSWLGFLPLQVGCWLCQGFMSRGACAVAVLISRASQGFLPLQGGYWPGRKPCLL